MKAHSWLGLNRRANDLRHRLRREVDELSQDLRGTHWWRAAQRIGSPQMIPRAFLLGFAVDQLRGTRWLRWTRTTVAGAFTVFKLSRLTPFRWLRDRARLSD
jgi:hypothetical protein